MKRRRAPEGGEQAPVPSLAQPEQQRQRQQRRRQQEAAPGPASGQHDGSGSDVKPQRGRGSDGPAAETDSRAATPQVGRRWRDLMPLQVGHGSTSWEGCRLASLRQSFAHLGLCSGPSILGAVGLPPPVTTCHCLPSITPCRTCRRGMSRPSWSRPSWRYSRSASLEQPADPARHLVPPSQAAGAS